MSLLHLETPHAIAIQCETVAKDDRKATVKTWSTVIGNLPASVHPLRLGAVPPEYRKEGAGTHYRVMFRHAELAGVRITTKHRIQYDGRVFKILHAMQVAQLTEYWSVLCEEMP